MSDGPSIGVLGTGHWGRNLLRNFHRLDVLAGFCDQNPDTAGIFGAQYPDVQSYPDADSLFADTAIDAVAIATPAVTHGDLTRRALEAGKHVFVEKPLCLDVPQGHTLKNDADRRGRVLMVGHLLLYHPAFRALKEFVDAGNLGNLRYIYSNRLSLGRIRREENALWSFAPHDVSMILALTGMLPDQVMTSGGTYLHPEVADTTISVLTFGGGVQAHIFVSWLHPYKDHRTVVIGTEGMAVFHDSLDGPDKLRHYPHKVGWNDDLPTVEKGESLPIAYGPEEPLAAECRHFVDCVTRGETPTSDAAEGLRVLSVLDACQKSLSCGLPQGLAGEPPCTVAALMDPV